MPDPITAVQFFEQPAVQFPIERDRDDFELFIDKRLQAYVDLVRGMNPADNITKQIRDEASKIEKLCGLLKAAIHEYMRGLPHKAYSHLDEGIRSVHAEFSRCISSDVDHPFLNELYRMRKEHEPGTTFAKRDLFHIPFDERQKVTRQRYSIPGLPCLYLGGSLYICWEELRRPKFESIHVARFQVAPGQRISVLDFMQRPPNMAAGVKTTTALANELPHLLNGFSALAVCWPLMARAAIRRKHGDAPFIAEYVIPQLILQWITDNNEPDLDGIAYSSVSCKTHVTYPALIGNFVFPAKEIAPAGHCPRLCRKFAMTIPIAWQVLQAVRFDTLAPYAATMQLELIPGVPTRYSHTTFCELEGNLRMLEATLL
jgi:hypothetical protein